MKNLLKRVINKQQPGRASIMVVGVLVIILSLVTIGFARLMNRELNQSLNNQLSNSATYAAESGINDALTLVKQNPEATIDNCDAGITALQNAGIGTSLAADSSSKYTCVLIDPSPKDIIFGSIPNDSSQVVKLIPKNGTIDSLMFSWEASNGTNVNFDSSAGAPLLDEPNWNSQNLAPVLRVSLYPTGPGGSILPSNKTYFFYPETSGGNNNVVVTDYNNDGALIGVRCGATSVPLWFSGSADLGCNVIVNNIDTGGGGASYIARITPVYTPAKVNIKGDSISPSGTVEFIGAQSLVDVTARAVDSVKRLQARANVTDVTNNIQNALTDTVPEYALRSAGTLCKRLIVPSDGTQIYTDTSIDNLSACNKVSITPPSAELYLNNTPGQTSITINPGQSATINWTSTNASRCTATGNWSGDKTPVSGGSQSTGSLNAGVYTYNIECFNNGPISSGVKTVTVNAQPPCPAPLAHTDNPFGVGDTSAYINGSVNPGTCTGLFSYFEWNPGNSINSSPSTTSNVALVPNGGDQTSTPQLTGLTPNTTYTYRICVTYANICGLPISFTTTSGGGSSSGGGGGGGAPDCVITSFSVGGTIVNNGQLAAGDHPVSGTFSHCYGGCSGFGTMSGGFGISYTNNYPSDNNVPGSGNISAGSTAGWGGVRCYSGRGGGNDEVGLYAAGSGGGSSSSSSGGGQPCGPNYQPPGCTGSPSTQTSQGCDWDFDGVIDDSTNSVDCRRFGGNYLIFSSCRWPNGQTTNGPCP